MNDLAMSGVLGSVRATDPQHAARVALEVNPVKRFDTWIVLLDSHSLEGHPLGRLNPFVDAELAFGSHKCPPTLRVARGGLDECSVRSAGRQDPEQRVREPSPRYFGWRGWSATWDSPACRCPARPTSRRLGPVHEVIEDGETSVAAPDLTGDGTHGALREDSRPQSSGLDHLG